MLNGETVSYVEVTTSEDDLGDETYAEATPVTLTAQVAIGDTREQFGDNAPDLNVSYTLYFLPGNLPAATSSSYFVVRGERCEVSGGPNGRWGSMGEVVAVFRAASRTAPAADPEGLFRVVTEAGVVAADETDPRLAVLEGIGFEFDDAGSVVFFGLDESLALLDDATGPTISYANLYLITASSEPSAPVGSFFSSGKSYVQQEIDDVVAYLASLGVTAELAGQGIWFQENLSPLTFVTA